ncbi:MAG: acetyl-CoA carboxylase carboxyl transferase subunit alpha, partial [Actinomycetota bacterium]
TILYRDPNKAQEIAPLLRPTSNDMLEMGIVDVVLPEPDDGAAIMARWLTHALASTVADRETRAARFRNLRRLL